MAANSAASRDPASAHPTRLPALDGLRGLAILGVMLHNLDVLEATPGSLLSVVGLAIDRGWMGVQLFFVLSGFLITGILLDARRDRHYLPDFFRRRVLRIFPLYYLSLVVLLLAVPAFGLQAPACADGGPQAPYWLFYSNWTQPYLAHESNCIDQFWSLAVEEQFYLIWPLLLWFCRRPRDVLALCLAVMLSAVITRMAMWSWQASPAAIYQFTVTRMDALALGGAAACLWRMPVAADWLRRHAGLGAWLAGGVLVAGLLVTRGYPRVSEVGQVWGYLFNSLGFTALLLAAAAADVSAAKSTSPARGGHPRCPLGQADRLGRSLLAALRLRALRRLGLYSFALYVVHKPVSFLIVQPLAARWLGVGVWPDRQSLWSSLSFTVIVAAISLILAMISWRWLESPLLGRRPAMMRQHGRTTGP